MEHLCNRDLFSQLTLSFYLAVHHSRITVRITTSFPLVPRTLPINNLAEIHDHPDYKWTTQGGNAFQSMIGNTILEGVTSQ